MIDSKKCPRCGDEHDCEPDGCRDPNCPLLEPGAFDDEPFQHCSIMYGDDGDPHYIPLR